MTPTQGLAIAFYGAVIFVVLFCLVVNGPILWRQLIAELRSWLPSDQGVITHADVDAIRSEHDREHRERVLMTALAQIGDSHRRVVPFQPRGSR